MDDTPRYIVSIAEHGSISKAARQVHLSQPALSQRLKQLEERLGVELFDRAKLPLKLTHAGQIYVDWAKETLALESRMSREIIAVAGKKTRRMRIGVSLPRCETIMPEMIAQFYREVQGCTISLIEAGTTEQLNRLLSEDLIDFAVLVPAKPDDILFSSEPICEERLLLLAPASWEIESKRSRKQIPLVDPEVISDIPFIMPPSHYYLNWLIRTLMDTAGVKLNVVLHCCSSLMMLETISRGVGASIMPNIAAFNISTSIIKRYEIRDCAKPNKLYLSHKQNWKPSSDAEVFLEIMRTWLHEHYNMLS